MTQKWAALLISTSICLSCASGPAPERSPQHIRKSIYYQNQGADLFTKGCYARAMDYFQSAHQTYAAADNQAGVVLALDSIGDTYFRLGDMESALLVYEDAAALREDGEKGSELVRPLSSKAATLIAMNRPEEAALILDRIEAIPNRGLQEALYLKTRALLLIEEKKFKQAEKLLERALSSPGGGEDGIASSIYFSLGRLLLQSDQAEKAVTRFERALIIDRKRARYHDIARDLEAIASSYAAMGDHGDATRFYKRSAKIYALLGDGQHTKKVVPNLKKSAATANIDIQATLHWIQTWLKDKSGGAICD